MAHLLGVMRPARSNTAPIFWLGMKLPPRMPNSSVTAMPMLDTWPELAAAEAMSTPQPVAASAAATTSSSTPSGWPQLSRNRIIDSPMRMVSCRKPPKKMPATLPLSTWPLVTGAASMRASVPSRRSDSSVRAPSVTAYIRNSRAMAGAK